MDIDRNSREIAAFRQTYQTVVDRTPVARDLEELTLTSVSGGPNSARVRPARRNAVFAAVAGALATLVVLGGVTLMFRSGGASPPGADLPSVSGPFIVLDDPASVLGPDARITSKESMAIAPGASNPVIRMQSWTRTGENGITEAIALLEGDAADELIYKFGAFSEIRNVEYGGFSFDLGEAASPAGPIGVEWTDDVSHRRYFMVGQGFTRDELLDFAAITARRSGDASEAIPDGLNPIYEGPQTLFPSPETIARVLVYQGEAGTVEIVSYEGFAITEPDMFLQWGEARGVDINDRPGVLAMVDTLTWGVIWTDGDDVTYFVTSAALTPDEVVEAARRVRSVTATRWEAIGAQPFEGPGTENQPTAASFLPVSERVTVASGNGWSVFGQVVEKKAGNPTAGNRGDCAWLERAGRSMIDFGCGFIPGGDVEFWPPFATTDGVVLIGEVSIETVTVRIDLENQGPIELSPVRLGAESSLALVAVELPASGETATITFYDSTGRQIDADPHNERLDLRIILEPEM
jgi:hypothetical protein